PAGLSVAIAVGKTNHAVGVRDVKKLRLGAGRIKRDPEWILEATIGKDYGRLHLSAALVPQDFDGVGIAFGDEDVAVWRCEKVPWIVKPAGVFLNLETRWDLGLSPLRPGDDSRVVGDGLGLIRRRQIIDGELVPDAWRILGPIGGHCSRAGQGFAIRF